MVKTYLEDQEKAKEGTMRGKQKREKDLGRGKRESITKIAGS